MKHLINFSIFEEVNPRDISFIESELNDYFTVAFEFEIETEDKSNIKTRYDELDEDVVEDIITIVMKDMSIRKKSERELVNNLAYELYDSIEYEMVDETTLDKIFDINKLSTEREKEIVIHLRDSIKSVVIEENYAYLKRMVKRTILSG